jgi:hypothetical protein
LSQAARLEAVQQQMDAVQAMQPHRSSSLRLRQRRLMELRWHLKVLMSCGRRMLKTEWLHA